MYKEVHVLNFTIYIISGTPVNVKIHRSLSANKRFLNMLKTGTQHPMTYHPIKSIFRKIIKLRRKNGLFKPDTFMIFFCAITYVFTTHS